MKTLLTIVAVCIMRLSVIAQLTLVSDAASSYSIVIADHASEEEKKASTVFQHYLKEISGAELPIITDRVKAGNREISIGKTNRRDGSDEHKLRDDGFIIETKGRNLLIDGPGTKSALYGVYHFLEQYLGCRKYSAEIKHIPKNATITIPSKISDVQNPLLSFREVYYPDQYDEEFRDWHKLHILEAKFGLWGHSYYKLVPYSQYFKSNPEYYALVNGERTDSQLCLSNPDVFAIVTRNLEKLIQEQPDKKLWSVSQNDAFGYCTCSHCKAIDDKHGGPQGSVIHFANKVAAKFPDKTISTLAYLYSARPPLNIEPAPNLSVMLSSITADRGKPFSTNPRTGLFRSDLAGWSAFTNNLMIWDYVVQFTNYQSPFPNIGSLQDNMNYFAEHKVNGVFIQGTEGSGGEFSPLKTYLLAKSTWNPKADLKEHFEDFMKGYFGDAGQYIKEYIVELENEFIKTNRLLDIYGDPVSEWSSWLAPEKLEKYSSIFDKAEKAAVLDPVFLKNVEAERLPIDYALIQQARFYGLEQHGMFIQEGDKWSVRPELKNKVDRFINAARKADIKFMSEGGHNVDSYASEWVDIFRQGPLLHEAIGSKVSFGIPYSTEYPGKGGQTLTDGTKGYNNLQYNYLGWYGTDLELTVDLGTVKDISSVSAGFLESQRNWTFLPLGLVVETSTDNINFNQAGSIKLANPEENYTKETHRLKINFEKSREARYVRIKADNLKQLPKWRDMPNRKSWIFCDEVAVYK